MQNYEKFGEIPVPLTRTLVKAAAPKTHCHTSERLGYEARKNGKKIN